MTARKARRPVCDELWQAAGHLCGLPGDEQDQNALKADTKAMKRDAFLAGYFKRERN